MNSLNIPISDGRFQLRSGMMFASNNPQGIGTLIKAFEKWSSKDLDADYGHTGIIQDANGKTLEARWTITEGNLFEEYRGTNVILAEPLNVSDEKIAIVISTLKKQHLGQLYPLWRLPLHLIPPLARRISYKGKWVVCSELTAKFEYLLNLRHEHFAGTTPDDLVDEWINWKNFNVVWEGVL